LLKVGYFRVDGDPELDQFYTVYAGFMREGLRWVTPSGLLELRIVDARGSVLFEGSRRVSRWSYEYPRIPDVGRIPLVVWDIPISMVKKGKALRDGKGTAWLYFKTGEEAAFKGLRIPIPRYPPVLIKNIFVKTNPPNLAGSGLLHIHAYPQYRVHEVSGEAVIEVSVRPFHATHVSIKGVKVKPGELRLIHVEPELPVVVERPGEVKLYITLEALEGYEGSIEVELEVLAVTRTQSAVSR